MTIGIDIRAIGKRGTGDEVYTTNLITNLAEHATKHTFFLFTDDERVREFKWIKALPEHMTVVVIPPAHRAIWTFIKLPKAVKKYDVDVLHVQYIAPLWFPSKTKLITTIHDISWKVVPRYIPPKDRRLLNTFIPLTIRKADRIITVSKHSREQIEQFYPAAKNIVSAIYNGGYISPESRAEVRRPESVPFETVDHPYILHVSSLQPRKNVPQLLRAYASFLNVYRDVSQVPLLVLAGGEGINYDTEIDTVIENENLEDFVVRTGHVSEVEKYRLYAHARLFVSLSLFEGFGIPFIEAMSFGVPVVGSNRSCLPEIIDKGGETVNPEDREAIAEKLYRLSTDETLRERYAREGIKRTQEFTWEKMARRTLEVYEDLLEE